MSGGNYKSLIRESSFEKMMDTSSPQPFIY